MFKKCCVLNCKGNYPTGLKVSCFKFSKDEKRKDMWVHDIKKLDFKHSCQSVQLVSQERKLSTRASRTMAAMSLGFIVLVTPWTIQEVVAACTGSRSPKFLDFLVTWFAISNSFWNPFLYWLLNNHFRRVSRELIYGIFRSSKEKQKQKQLQQQCCNNTPPFVDHTPGCDLERLSEKYWGEILERTVSSTSLHALNRVHSTTSISRTNSNPHVECNGSVHEIRVFGRQDS